MSGPLRAVLFDAVRTLIAPDPPVAEAYHAAGRTFGSRHTVEAIRLRFRSALARQEARDAHPTIAHRTSESRERQRWRTIVGEVFDDASDPEGVFQALWDHFARPEHWRLYDDVPDCWRQLTAAGYLVGIASNFDDRLDGICLSHALLADSRRFVSSQLGHKKPSLEFFRSIERSLALRPEQILLVGDDLENDFHAARRAGWQAILLSRNQPAIGCHFLPNLSILCESLG
jgi:putative hydrolase of the HAD superfamily